MQRETDEKTSLDAKYPDENDDIIAVIGDTN